jgi:serine/threonine protein kinase
MTTGCGATSPSKFCRPKPPTASAGNGLLAKRKRWRRSTIPASSPSIPLSKSGDIHFLTMEVGRRADVDALIPRVGFRSIRLLALAIPLADAVGAAHSQGIVHIATLKPTNVMVTRDGRVRVMDFGLAKLSRSRQRCIDAQDAVRDRYGSADRGWTHLRHQLPTCR